MSTGQERTYRRQVRAEGLVSFQLAVKETDLWISALRDLTVEARDLVFGLRHQIESYIRLHPEFTASLEPFPTDPFAPPIVRDMIAAGRAVDVGPMAAVAGAIAQAVATGLLSFSPHVIVENGGDIYLQADRPLTVAIHAGPSPLSEHVGLRIPVRQMPLGVCSSSGVIGHSLSLGRADAVCVLSSSAALADAAATALGNRIGGHTALEAAAQWAQRQPELLGGVAIVGDRLASWGAIELVRL